MKSPNTLLKISVIICTYNLGKERKDIHKANKRRSDIVDRNINAGKANKLRIRITNKKVNKDETIIFSINNVNK